jgi:hypothetical protein
MENPFIQYYLWYYDVLWKYWPIVLVLIIIAMWLIYRCHAKRQREEKIRKEKYEWHNCMKETPEEGERVLIRIIISDKTYDFLAIYKLNESTNEHAFFWDYGFCKVSNGVLWRRF